MPTTTSGGSSNAWEDPPQAEEPPAPVAWVGEYGPEPVEPIQLPPASIVLPEGWTADPGPAPEPVADGPGYGSMTQAALRDEAKARELPVYGSKAELAARLAEHDAASATAAAEPQPDPAPDAEGGD